MKNLILRALKVLAFPSWIAKKCLGNALMAFSVFVFAVVFPYLIVEIFSHTWVIGAVFGVYALYYGVVILDYSLYVRDMCISYNKRDISRDTLDQTLMTWGEYIFAFFFIVILMGAYYQALLLLVVMLLVVALIFPQNVQRDLLKLRTYV